MTPDEMAIRSGRLRGRGNNAAAGLNFMSNIGQQAQQQIIGNQRAAAQLQEQRDRQKFAEEERQRKAEQDRLDREEEKRRREEDRQQKIRERDEDRQEKRRFAEEQAGLDRTRDDERWKDEQRRRSEADRQNAATKLVTDEMSRRQKASVEETERRRKSEEEAKDPRKKLERSLAEEKQIRLDAARRRRDEARATPQKDDDEAAEIDLLEELNPAEAARRRTEKTKAEKDNDPDTRLKRDVAAHNQTRYETAKQKLEQAKRTPDPQDDVDAEEGLLEFLNPAEYGRRQTNKEMERRNTRESGEEKDRESRRRSEYDRRRSSMTAEQIADEERRRAEWDRKFGKFTERESNRGTREGQQELDREQRRRTEWDRQRSAMTAEQVADEERHRAEWDRQYAVKSRGKSTDPQVQIDKSQKNIDQDTEEYNKAIARAKKAAYKEAQDRAKEMTSDEYAPALKKFYDEALPRHMEMEGVNDTGKRLGSKNYFGGVRVPSEAEPMGSGEQSSPGRPGPGGGAGPDEDVLSMFGVDEEQEASVLDSLGGGSDEDTFQNSATPEAAFNIPGGMSGISISQDDRDALDFDKFARRVREKFPDANVEQYRDQYPSWSRAQQIDAMKNPDKYFQEKGIEPDVLTQFAPAAIASGGAVAGLGRAATAYGATMSPVAQQTAGLAGMIAGSAAGDELGRELGGVPGAIIGSAAGALPGGRIAKLYQGLTKVASLGQEIASSAGAEAAGAVGGAVGGPVGTIIGNLGGGMVGGHAIPSPSGVDDMLRLQREIMQSYENTPSAAKVSDLLKRSNKFRDPNLTDLEKQDAYDALVELDKIEKAAAPQVIDPQQMSTDDLMKAIQKEPDQTKKSELLDLLEKKMSGKQADSAENVTTQHFEDENPMSVLESDERSALTDELTSPVDEDVLKRVAGPDARSVEVHEDAKLVAQQLIDEDPHGFFKKAFDVVEKEQENWDLDDLHDALEFELSNDPLGKSMWKQYAKQIMEAKYGKAASDQGRVDADELMASDKFDDVLKELDEEFGSKQGSPNPEGIDPATGLSKEQAEIERFVRENDSDGLLNDAMELTASQKEGWGWEDFKEYVRRYGGEDMIDTEDIIAKMPGSRPWEDVKGIDPATGRDTSSYDDLLEGLKDVVGYKYLDDALPSKVHNFETNRHGRPLSSNDVDLAQDRADEKRFGRLQAEGEGRPVKQGPDLPDDPTAFIPHKTPFVETGEINPIREESQLRTGEGQPHENSSGMQPYKTPEGVEYMDRFRLEDPERTLLDDLNKEGKKVAPGGMQLNMLGGQDVYEGVVKVSKALYKMASATAGWAGRHSDLEDQLAKAEGMTRAGIPVPPQKRVNMAWADLRDAEEVVPEVANTIRPAFAEYQKRVNDTMKNVEPFFKDIEPDSKVDQAIAYHLDGKLDDAELLKIGGQDALDASEMMRLEYDTMFSQLEKAGLIPATTSYRNNYITYLRKNMGKLFGDLNEYATRDVRMRFLQKRNGKDIPAGLSAIESFSVYTDAAQRKLHMTSAVDNARVIMKRYGSGVMGRGQRVYAEMYLNRLMGKPTLGQKTLDYFSEAASDLLKRTTGVEANIDFTKVAVGARLAMSMAILGLNQGSALTNGIMGAIGAAAGPNFRQAMKKYNQEGYKKTTSILKELQLSAHESPTEIGKREIRSWQDLFKTSQYSSANKKLEKVMFSTMDATNNVTLGLGYWQGVINGQSVGARQGLTGKELQEFAHGAGVGRALEVQNIGGVVERSPAFSDPITALLGQFVRPTVKQADLVLRKIGGQALKGNGNQLVKYLAGTGATILIGQQVFGVDLKEKLTDYLNPAQGFGTRRFFNADDSPLGRLVGNIASGKVGRAATMVLPGGVAISRFVNAFIDDEKEAKSDSRRGLEAPGVGERLTKGLTGYPNAREKAKAALNKAESMTQKTVAERDARIRAIREAKKGLEQFRRKDPNAGTVLDWVP